jgi:hypothetical protein
MTQTMRRELRLKFEKILIPALSDNPQTQDAIDYACGLAEQCADAAMEVAGIAKSKKFNDPMWDLLHGETSTEEGMNAARLSEAYTDIANRLSAGLKRGEFSQSTEAQKVYKWIYEKEQAGQSLDRFITWAMEGRRGEFSFIYHKDLTLIKRDWLQVFPSDNVQIAQPDNDGGFR